VSGTGSRLWFVSSLALASVTACGPGGIKDQSQVRHDGAPGDLELSLTTLEFGCHEGGADTPLAQACRIAKDFGAGEPFTDWPSEGGQVWFGRIYGIHDDKAPTSDLYFLRIQAGKNTSTLLSMDELEFLLPVEYHANEFFPESEAEEADANAVLDAIAKGQPPPADSGAVAFLRAAEPPRGYRAVAQSSSASFILMQSDRIFGRQHADRLLLIQRGEFGRSVWLSELWRLP
jgi:hypothetical protein